MKRKRICRCCGVRLSKCYRRDDRKQQKRQAGLHTRWINYWMYYEPKGNINGRLLSLLITIGPWHGQARGRKAPAVA